MMFEMTIQLRVTDFEQGQKWYETLLNRRPDFMPHEGFAEWEVIPGCWLQVAEGIPSEGSGPVRLAVNNLEAEQERIMKELNVDHFEIYARDEVPVRWGTFSDPWGNQLGFFEYVDKNEENEVIQKVWGNQSAF
ncbi:VOC family protein [Peribacillus sp. FSL H8-0477]|uniref:VOC family protein n=1 Tax=Peribacillus sp. FSL H8-0477 TaxID=2921388 RepID=UPI0030FCD82E